ncbi:MAG TPA: hypothetical protein DCS21_02505 [Gammaproteobacteria bacterium]|nr:hypothetical protein [Gammaproteobacteria bacterium]
MVSLVLDAPVRPARTDTRPVVRAPRPLPLPHPPESMIGTPYYDDEFEMAQSIAHMHTIYYVGSLLNRVAKAADLRVVSDNPVWYWLPEAGRQRALYPDYALTANPRVDRLTADELVLALEVVSTTQPPKEAKDTVLMRERNAAHGVREFVLIYPEPDDPRSVVWHGYDEWTGRYQVAPLPTDGRYRSVAVPGLELEVLPPEEWTLGRKVRVWFRGQELRDGEAEAHRREAAEAQAAQERTRAEQERAEKEVALAEKEQEQARAARLAERLRALGIDPETV